LKTQYFILFLILGHYASAQDTVYFKGKPVRIGKVVEVGESYVAIAENPDNLAAIVNYNIEELRKIKFAGGYVEKFGSDSTYGNRDTIQYINRELLSCDVTEIGETAVVVEINHGDSTIVVALDSIATIAYANGFIEKYRDTLSTVVAVIPTEETKPHVVSIAKIIISTPPEKSNPSVQTPIEREPNTTNITQIDVVTKRSRSEKKTGSGVPKAPTISSISNRPYIGIGMVVDSLTGLTRSFAFYELVKNNLLSNGTDTLFPVMVDYHFNSPYAITGISNNGTVHIKLYKKGKKIDDLWCKDAWPEIYSALKQSLEKDNYLPISKKLHRVFEGSIDNIDAKKIEDCLPGTIESNVPYNRIVDTLLPYARIDYFRNGNPYDNSKNLYGKYNTYYENKLFFFRNDQVPDNLKTAAKPLVFPLYRSMAPGLTYLSCGKEFEEAKDYGAALNCFQAAIVSTNILLTSPFERALARSLVFDEMAKTHLLLSSNRVYCSQLFNLCRDLNTVYVKSQQAEDERNQYYKNIGTIKDLCMKAEEKARQIRGQKRLGAFMAALSFVGSVSAASVPNNSDVSAAYLNEAVNYLTTSIEESSQVSQALQDQYQNIQNMISSKEFIIGDGTETEVGKSMMVGEVYYYIKTCPNLVKPVLIDFAKDKPKLNNLFENYFNGSTSGSNVTELLSLLAEFEKTVLNLEVRKLPVTKKSLSQF